MKDQEIVVALAAAKPLNHSRYADRHHRGNTTAQMEAHGKYQIVRLQGEGPNLAHDTAITGGQAVEMCDARLIVRRQREVLRTDGW